MSFILKNVVTKSILNWVDLSYYKFDSLSIIISGPIMVLILVYGHDIMILN